MKFIIPIELCKTSPSEYKVLRALAVIAIDIDGTLATEIDHVFFNPSEQEVEGEPTFEVSDLREIMEIL